jgi:hypothetical protein
MNDKLERVWKETAAYQGNMPEHVCRDWAKPNNIKIFVHHHPVLPYFLTNELIQCCLMS